MLARVAAVLAGILGLSGVEAARAAVVDFGPTKYLQTCPSGGSEPMCDSQREKLIAEWPKALQGDYQSQKNVSYCLSTGCRGAVRVDRIAGCAWRIVILASGNAKIDRSDNDNFRSYCREGLSDADIAASKVAAGQIFDQVYKRLLPPPPWEWLLPVADINLDLGPDNKGAFGMVKVALRMAAQCPGATVDQARVNAILGRLGVKPSDIPGGIYDAAAVAAQMELDYPGFRRSQSPASAASNCNMLDTNYGRAGRLLPGLAAVPMPARYP